MAGRGRLAWRFDYAGSPKNPRIKSSATGRFKPLFTRRPALNKPFREYAIAAKIGCTPQTLRDWVRKAEVDSGQRVVGRLACHGSILSGVGASGKPGAVQSEVPNFVAVSRSPTCVDGPIAPAAADSGRPRFYIETSASQVEGF